MNQRIKKKLLHYIMIWIIVILLLLHFLWNMLYLLYFDYLLVSSNATLHYKKNLKFHFLNVLMRLQCSALGNFILNILSFILRYLNILNIRPISRKNDVVSYLGIYNVLHTLIARFFSYGIWPQTNVWKYSNFNA